MRIGFITGSIARIGSGRTEALPLARALARQGCEVYGLETTRFIPRRENVEDLEVYFEPVAPYAVPTPRDLLKVIARRHANNGGSTGTSSLRRFDAAAGDALLAVGNRLDIDVVYAFHNTNAAKLIRGWPHPSRLLAINLIGFGIDQSRGGASDTFPLQRTIFEHPYWDVHVCATRFEYGQYLQVYEQLGIDPTKLMHLPHSYDDELFRPGTRADTMASQRGHDRPRRLLYPVNVYPRKNIELAIDVIAHLKPDADFRLIVTGRIWDEDYHTRLLKHARRAGVADRVEFLGGVPLAQLIEQYRQADVTIYTSHQETFGHGIVESLGCGTPVVGPNWILPCCEILAASPGAWTAPKNRDGFAAAVWTAQNAAYTPDDIAYAARASYGNMAIAWRFLERCQELRAEKAAFRSAVASINWKGLYRDAGDLL